MYNTRSRGRIVLAGAVRPHKGIRVGMLPTELSPSQALDVLESEEMIPDTEVSSSVGRMIASELSAGDNAMVSSESAQPILSSPREGFQHNNNKILQQPQNRNLILYLRSNLRNTVIFDSHPLRGCWARWIDKKKRKKRKEKSSLVKLAAFPTNVERPENVIKRFVYRMMNTKQNSKRALHFIKRHNDLHVTLRC